MTKTIRKLILNYYRQGYRPDEIASMLKVSENEVVLTLESAGMI